MKAVFKKFTALFAFATVAAALVTPAHAARTGGTVIIILPAPKPVVSAF